MAISLTPAAADRVRHFLAERGRGVGLRLAVRKTGCSGFAYVVNYADAVLPGDQVFDSQGVSVLVDADSLQLIDGTEVDFVRHGPQRGVPLPEPQRAWRMRLWRELQRLIFPFRTGTSAHVAIAAVRARRLE